MAIYKILQKILGRILPLKRNRIMFYVRQGQGLACSPKYIMEYFIKTYPGQYELIWVSENPEGIEETPGFRVVTYQTGKYFMAFIQTRLYITNDIPDENLYKRQGQTILTTWHGGAYKKAGFDTSSPKSGYEEKLQKHYGRLDYFLSSGRAFTEYYASAFHISKEQFLGFGLPQNDIFFRQEPAINEKVRQYFGLSENTKVLLYVPSFRDTKTNNPSLPTDADLEKFLLHLEKITEETWVCISRQHYFVARKAQNDFKQPEKKSEKILDGTFYPDMQELLYTADILLTDFSSCIWDFSFTSRPVFLYQKETESYQKNDRGFFVPPEEWPYPIAKNLEELMTLATEFRKAAVRAEYRRKVIEHHHKLGAFENGKATERVVEFLVEEILNFL